MTHRIFLTAGLVAALFAASAAADDKPARPGPTDKGFLLPNGWTLSPAGKQVPLTDLPLNILPLADGKHAIVATSGYNTHELSLVDLESLKIVDQQTVRQSWFGLTVDPSQDRVWWSGGGAGMVHSYDLKDLKLARTSPAEPGPANPKDVGTPANPKVQPPIAVNKNSSFRSGLFLDAKQRILYSLDINKATITASGLGDDAQVKTVACGVRPYDVLMSHDGAMLYVSDWAGRAVLALDPKSLRVVAKIPVGEHPNQLALHPADDRLFVACASSDSIYVIDRKRGVVIERVHTALFPRAPEGSTPDALAASPDGKTLYVANADNNCIAVIDIADSGKSQVRGFIPTGWYPTAVAVAPDGKTLLVGVGKGNETKPNPFYTEKKEPADQTDDAKKSDDEARKLPFPYIGTLMSGALSVIPVPDEKQLVQYTAAVYRNCPYSDKLLASAPSSTIHTAIPTKPGDSTPIKYVIYIIKENRTYDQVFGDLKKGDGDATLVMFGHEVTPNHHKLAEEFVLLDNLYCNGQVSADGHPWSTMAYHTDYIARNWHLTYSKRKGVEDDDDGDLSNGPSGYLWDACARAGLGYRSYGEYGKRVSSGDGASKMESREPGLVGHICPDYGVLKEKGVRMRDTDNVDVFLKEYHDFEQKNAMPRFIVMSMGEDHTAGTKVGEFTPKACVASNDLALGRLVEAVTHGKYWKETAIFVIEDDAQNGADHVDCHRTVGLVVSPYTRRGAVDSTQYSTVSMVRTMELILGLPPLSQYDAAARPMYACFSDQADLKPYTSEKAQIDLATKNTKKSYGAERSGKMDFSDYDLADESELNEILWRSIKGADSPLPPAVRRAIADRPVQK
jgi:YVTN family beta-propeller protein